MTQAQKVQIYVAVIAANPGFTPPQITPVADGIIYHFESKYPSEPDAMLDMATTAEDFLTGYLQEIKDQAINFPMYPGMSLDDIIESDEFDNKTDTPPPPRTKK